MGTPGENTGSSHTLWDWTGLDTGRDRRISSIRTHTQSRVHAINKSTNQSINQPTNINQPINQYQPTSQLIHQSPWTPRRRGSFPCWSADSPCAPPSPTRKEKKGKGQKGECARVCMCMCVCHPSQRKRVNRRVCVCVCVCVCG
jgi:hypothetical protein